MNKEIQKIIDDRVTAAYGRGVLAGRIQEINRQIDEEEKELTIQIPAGPPLGDLVVRAESGP